jgi:hypothetical protein
MPHRWNDHIVGLYHQFNWWLRPMPHRWNDHIVGLYHQLIGDSVQWHIGGMTISWTRIISLIGGSVQCYIGGMTKKKTCSQFMSHLRTSNQLIPTCCVVLTVNLRLFCIIKLCLNGFYDHCEVDYYCQSLLDVSPLFQGETLERGDTCCMCTLSFCLSSGLVSSPGCLLNKL